MFPPPLQQNKVPRGGRSNVPEGKSSDPECCFASMANKPALCGEVVGVVGRGVLEEHPDLSSTSDPQLAPPPPCSISFDAASIPVRPAEAGEVGLGGEGGGRCDQGRLCLVQCVSGCVSECARVRRSGAASKRSIRP